MSHGRLRNHNLEVQNPPCDLEVLVNQERTFLLNKRYLLARCGRLYKEIGIASSSLSSSTAETSTVSSQRVVIHDFPGGSAAFELVARFCYSAGNIKITTTNIAMLRCAADFMEMTEEYGEENLIRQTETFLTNMSFWSFEETLIVLKSCEVLSPLAEKTLVVHRCVDSLSLKASSSSNGSSPMYLTCDSNVYRDSVDSKGYECLIPSSKSWWSEDMSSLSMYFVERVVKAMVRNNVDNKLLGKFLLHYLQASLTLLGYTSVCARKTVDPDEGIFRSYAYRVQREVLELVVSLIYSLHRTSITCRSLFGIQRLAIVLQANIYCKKQLEEMIGYQLDKATLDNILVRAAPSDNNSIYDVDLILRLVTVFIENRETSRALDNLQLTRVYPDSTSQNSPLKTVGRLIDMYLAEIAPDPNLRASKFKALAEALPDYARDCHNGLFRALDIFLEAHNRLTENDTVELCKLLNYHKLSLEACKQLITQNSRFPTIVALQVLILQQAKLRNSIEAGLMQIGKPTNHSSEGFITSDSSHNQMPLCSHELDYDLVVQQNEEIKSDLQRMQSRVVELEVVCRKMRSEVKKHVK